MNKHEEFVKEVDELLKKHKVERFTGMIHLEERVRLLSHAPTSEEEVENTKEYTRLVNLIGSFETENVKKLNDFLEDLIIRSEEQESISQVTWESIAYQNAEELLSEEDYENLENAQILKNAAIQSNEWEYAAKYREEELSFLTKVMEIVELKNPR